MKKDALNRFKDELDRRGLLRKIQLCVNMAPPTNAGPESMIRLHKSAAKMAIISYAAKHDDFYDTMVDAALEYLLDGVLTDDLFHLDSNFIPTKEEIDTVEQAKETAEVMTSLLYGLADILKTI